MFSLMLLLATAVADPVHFIPKFQTFGWKDQVVTNYVTFAGLAAAVVDPEEAAAMRRAAERRGNGAEVFGSVIDRLSDRAAAERYARVFKVEHPLFGSPAQLVRLRPEYRAQLIELTRRGLSVETVSLLRVAFPRVTYHGSKFLRQELARTEGPRDEKEWTAVVYYAQDHCEGLLADLRRTHKQNRMVERTAAAFRELVRIEGKVSRPEEEFLVIPAGWTPGDLNELYAELDRYEGWFAEFEVAARAFRQRPFGRGFRPLLERRETELRLAFLDYAETQVRARIDYARASAERLARRRAEISGHFDRPPDSTPPFDPAAGLDPVREQFLKRERARLRALHHELSRAIRG